MRVASQLLSELVFGSLLAYSPRGRTEVSVRSRRIRDKIKAGDSELLAKAIQRLSADFAATDLSAVLGPDVILVPAPRSAPLVQGGLWPPLTIAGALVAAGFGREVRPWLTRTEAVPKSAFSRPGERPNALRHFETMIVEPELAAPTLITVVDDFLTKGNTLLGAASRIQLAYPAATVCAFALVRTLGLQPEIEKVVDPCVGMIRRAGFGDEADREP